MILTGYAIQRLQDKGRACIVLYVRTCYPSDVLTVLRTPRERERCSLHHKRAFEHSGKLSKRCTVDMYRTVHPSYLHGGKEVRVLYVHMYRSLDLTSIEPDSGSSSVGKQRRACGRQQTDS